MRDSKDRSDPTRKRIIVSSPPESFLISSSLGYAPARLHWANRRLVVLEISNSTRTRHTDSAAVVFDHGHVESPAQFVELTAVGTAPKSHARPIVRDRRVRVGRSDFFSFSEEKSTFVLAEFGRVLRSASETIPELTCRSKNVVNLSSNERLNFLEIPVYIWIT